MTQIWNVNDFWVENALPKTAYIPNFISEVESIQVLEEIESNLTREWEHIDGRFKQDWPYQLDSHGLIAFDPIMPKWIPLIYSRFMETKNLFPSGHKTNFIRVNKYLPGQGIQPHLDSTGTTDRNALLTLGSSSLMEFYEPKIEQEKRMNNKFEGSLFLEPNSLTVLSDPAYSYYLHGISATKVDVLNEKVYNRPDKLPLNTRVRREIRYSITLGWYSEVCSLKVNV